VLIFSLFRLNTPNYFYFILIAIILTPIVYSKILKLIPGIIKIQVQRASQNLPLHLQHIQLK